MDILAKMWWQCYRFNWTAMSSKYLDVMFFFRCIFTSCVWHPLSGILLIFETPKGLHRLENVTRACIHKAASRKCVKYLFWVNSPFHS